MARSPNHRMAAIGAGVALGLALMAFPFACLTEPAHRMLAIMALVVVFWITEPIPLWVTALLGCGLCALLGVAPVGALALSFTDPILLLFVGSFLLAKAMQVHGLDRRLAYSLLSHPLAGAGAHRTLFAFALAAFLLGMWVSITASVAMLFPVALVAARAEAEKSASRYTTAFLLMLPYAAAAGAMATPIGTPPNLIGLAFIRESLGEKVGFLEWMAIGLPVALVLLAVRYAIVVAVFRPGDYFTPGHFHKMREAYRMLGAWTRAEKFTAAAFCLAVLLWVTPAISHRLSPGVAAVLAAGLLFVLPSGHPGHKVLRLKDAVRIDWGTIVLFGGGIALGRQLFDTGLGTAIADAWLLGDQPPGVLWLAGAAVLFAVALSEIASNTAAANVVIPVILSAAGPHTEPALCAAFAATLGTSLGFMLPVSTPANAIVYGSGAVRLRDMVRTGILVDLAGIPIVWLAAVWLVPKILL